VQTRREAPACQYGGYGYRRITPLAQGEATHPHPIVVLLAAIVGGMIAGIVGLRLAIPVTASARTLVTELATPRIRRWESPADTS
jgi:predicted PurR-regulated permease PerM